jgi:hypothetical protein
MGSNMGAAFSESFRNALLARVEAGEVTETRGGQPSALLQAAKLIKDAGVPVDAAMLDRIDTAVGDARETGNFNAAMRAFVADTVQRASRPETVATQFDPVTLPIYEASNMTERKKAAKPIINGIIDAVAGDAVVPAKVVNQAATQMAQRAARNEVFNAAEVVRDVLTANEIAVAPEVAAQEDIAPTLAPSAAPAAPSVDEVAVAPVKAAIEAVTAPEPPAPGVVPSLAQTAAREMGIAETQEQLPQGQLFQPVPTETAPTAIEEELAARDQEVSQELLTPEEQVEPTIADTATVEGITPEVAPEAEIAPEAGIAPEMAAPEAAFTPQQVVDDLDTFAFDEAESRGVDPELFVLGADDVKNGREPIPAEQITAERGPEAAAAYGAGRQWAQDRIAEAQAAPTQAAPTLLAETAPAAPTTQDVSEMGGTEPLTDANVTAVTATELTPAQMRRLEQAAGIDQTKLDAMQRRIARSRDGQETLNLAGKLMKLARNPTDSVNILTSLFNSTPPKVLQGLLAMWETADVVRLGTRAGLKNPARIDDLMRNEFIPYVNRMMRDANRFAERWADFASRSDKGAVAVEDVMYYANMVNADPTLAPNASAYLRQDKDYQALRAEMLAEKDPKAKSTLKGRVTKRQNEIRRLYTGATDPDGTKIHGWNDLSQSDFGGGAGKQIFREARDYYRRNLNEHYRLLMERIDSGQFDEDVVTKLKDAVDEMFAPTKERVIYFPLKRFGEYWVTVGKGAAGEFHMFESASAQEAFMARLREEKDPRPTSSGYGRDTLRGLVAKRDTSAALKNILDLLDDGAASDINVLKDHVFQMYLTALPEADIRQRFIHRQFKTGFSTDALRTFATTAISSTNQLSRLAYRDKFTNLIEQAKAETEGMPSKPRLDTITRELEMRVNGILSPRPQTSMDWWTSLGAKTTFLFLLSSPKSAFLNLSQLQIVGVPALSAEFGEAATATMMARYTAGLVTGSRVANPFVDEEGNVRLQMPKFTAEQSRYIKELESTDPDRYDGFQRAWRYAEEREITQSTFSAAADIYERSDRPTGELGFTQSLRKGEYISAAQRATVNTMQGLGTLFHHSERIGREIMYMSAFEMAYDRNLKSGMAPKKAADAAMEKAAELTNKAMFDFSNWNKSRAAKHPAGKLALQMRQYSLSMTSLLVRSAYNLIAAPPTKQGKLAAARMFFGVAGMTALYGGIRSTQIGAMAMMAYGAYEFFKDALGDDGEEQELEQGYLGPETIERELLKYADEKGRELSRKDMDYYIRTVWIPDTFGPGGTMQEALGLSDDAAKKLATVADIGLPGLFGVDISNSVSLGDLWHPVTTKSDDPEVQMFESIGRMALGPTGSTLAAPIKSVRQANEGDLDRAIETSMPAVIRSFMKAQRLQEEGLVIGKNRDVVLKDPSFYDTYAVIMQSMGFPEASTSRDMQIDIAAGDIERGISQERSRLLDNRYRAMLKTGTDQSEDAQRELRAVERAIEIYNLNYPSNAITEDTKAQSFAQKQREAAERMYGLKFDEKIPVRRPEAERRLMELFEDK